MEATRKTIPYTKVPEMLTPLEESPNIFKDFMDAKVIVDLTLDQELKGVVNLGKKQLVVKNLRRALDLCRYGHHQVSK